MKLKAAFKKSIYYIEESLYEENKGQTWSLKKTTWVKLSTLSFVSLTQIINLNASIWTVALGGLNQFLTATKYMLLEVNL